MIRICSGTGHHLYVRLSERVAPDRLAGINRMLAALLDGDAKWSAASMLRVPGTYSWKPVAAGGAVPAVVRRVL